MRVAVLAYQLRVAGGLAVGRNIIAALRRVADRHEFLLILPAGLGYESIEKPSRCEFVYFRRSSGRMKQLLFERWKLPGLLRAWRPDLVWGLGNSGLTRPGAPQAILFHKAHFVYGPEFIRREPLFYRVGNLLAQRRLLRCLPGTQLILCQTQTIARRIPEHLGFRGRVAVMPNAVSRFAEVAGRPPKPAPLAPLEGTFKLFCLARYYTHKNLEILAEAFERYPDELADVRVILTVAADQHPRAPRFVARLQSPALRERLINVGPLPEDALASYYTHCDALVLPTRLESFTATYVEAMRYGCPILTSDLDFAREICGDAADYFDPLDARDVCRAVCALRDSDERRRALAEAGRRRSATFVRDWDSIVADAFRELEAVAASRTMPDAAPAREEAR